MSSMLAVLSPRNSFKSDYGDLLTRTESLSHFQTRSLSDVAVNFLDGRGTDAANPEEVYRLAFEDEFESLSDYLAQKGVHLSEDHFLRLLKKDGVYVETEGMPYIHISYSYYKALIMHIISDVEPEFFIRKIRAMKSSGQSLLLLDATTEQEFAEFSDEQVLVLLPVHKTQTGWDLLQNTFTLPHVYKELYIENVADVCWNHFLESHKEDLNDDLMFYLGNLNYPALGRDKWNYLLINHECNHDDLLAKLSEVL